MGGAYILSEDFPIKAISFGNEWLVYHTGEAKTHRLGGILAEVFSLFFVSQGSDDLSASKILHEITRDNADIDVSEIEKSLNVLINLNLVVRVN